MNRNKIISIILIFCLMTGFLAYPTPVYAKNIFQRLFQFLKWSTHHIVTGPGKIAAKLTRPLGPILGPIAANIILANMPNKLVKIITQAQKVKSLTAYEDQTKKLNQAKAILNQRSDEIADDIDNLYDLREQLQKNLLSGDVKFSQYKDEVVALDEMIEGYENLQDRMLQAADNLKPENLLKQIATDVFKSGSKTLGNHVMRKVGDELKKLVNAEVVNKFLGKGGLNALKVIDLIVAGDTSSILLEIGYSKDDPDFAGMLEEIKKEIKDQLKSDRDYLKGNWRKVMKEKIQEIIGRLEKERRDLNANASKIDIGNSNENTNMTSSNVNDPGLLDELLDFEEDDNENANTSQTLSVDADGCLPGYSFDRLSGTGCVQTNCYDINDAHNDSLGHCICGTTGSVAYDPKAKNQACKYDDKYATCPGCVYKCDYEDGDCVED